MKILVIALIVFCLYVYVQAIWTIIRLKRRISTMELFFIAFFPVVGCLLWLLYNNSLKSGDRSLHGRKTVENLFGGSRTPYI